MDRSFRWRSLVPSSCGAAAIKRAARRARRVIIPPLHPTALTPEPAAPCSFVLPEVLARAALQEVEHPVAEARHVEELHQVLRQDLELASDPDREVAVLRQVG